jgi:hypothetical protein
MGWTSLYYSYYNLTNHGNHRCRPLRNLYSNTAVRTNIQYSAEWVDGWEDGGWGPEGRGDGGKGLERDHPGRGEQGIWSGTVRISDNTVIFGPCRCVWLFTIVWQ